MSDFDSNPFADPDLNNPFKDPSVTQVTRNVPPGLDEYNPFSDSRTEIPGQLPFCFASEHSEVFIENQIDRPHLTSLEVFPCLQ